MRRRVCLLSVAALCAVMVVSGQAPTPPVVLLSDLPRYVGQVVTLEDTVTHTNTEAQSEMFYLNFGPFPQQFLAVAIPDAKRAEVDPLVLRGGRLRVTGLVELDGKGRPRIVYREGTILRAVPSPGAAATPVAPAGPVARPAASTPTGAPTTAGVLPIPASPTSSCCRVCSTGKPCGNSCIARTSTCRQPPGCAC